MFTSRRIIKLSLNDISRNYTVSINNGGGSTVYVSRSYHHFKSGAWRTSAVVTRDWP
jgi:hypothetical protein